MEWTAPTPDDLAVVHRPAEGEGAGRERGGGGGGESGGGGLLRYSWRRERLYRAL